MYSEDYVITNHTTIKKKNCRVANIRYAT